MNEGNVWEGGRRQWQKGGIQDLLKEQEVFGQQFSSVYIYFLVSRSDFSCLAPSERIDYGYNKRESRNIPISIQEAIPER